jgi:hypothetical protein
LTKLSRFIGSVLAESVTLGKRQGRQPEGMVVGFLSLAAVLSPAAPPELPDFRPVRYYAQACSRCHGDDGKTFGPKLAGKSREEVEKKVASMASGSAQAPLKPGRSEVVTDLVLSWGRKQPFLVATKHEAGRIYVEASRGAKLTAKLGGHALKQEKHRGQETFLVPSGKNWRDAVVTASLNDKTKTLRLSERAWTQPN